MTDAALGQWATPSHRDYRSDHSRMSDEELYGKKGRPLSRQATVTYRDGRQDPRTPDGKASRPVLNPLFVEWLMGFCIGWTDLKPLAMPSFLQWQRTHGGC